MLSKLKSLLKSFFLKFKRFLNKISWNNSLQVRSINPVSRKFGLDRGTPIDRIYIEHFLKNNSSLIKGDVLEIAEDTYSRKFGNNVNKINILSPLKSIPKTTIVGDLTNYKNLPENIADAFICTQTLNFIFDFKSAVKGIHKLLKKNGVVLLTVSGISQISRYDYDRWGDYWRFTDKSIEKVFAEVFGKKNIKINTYGNVLSTISFLHGISSEELKEDEIFHNDNDYQMIITVIAKK